MAVEIWDRQTGEQYLAFSGSYTSSLEPFAPANDRVVYRIDSGGAPGAERTQRVRLRGNILTWLGVTELTDGDYWSAEIVWERVSG